MAPIIPTRTLNRRANAVVNLAALVLALCLGTITWGAGWLWGGLAVIACCCAFLIGGLADKGAAGKFEPDNNRSPDTPRTFHISDVMTAATEAPPGFAGKGRARRPDEEEG